MNSSCVLLGIRETAQYVAFGYVTPIIGTIGAIGSFLNFIAANNSRLKAPTYVHLAFLSLFNSIALFSQTFFSIIFVHASTTSWGPSFLAWFIFPVFKWATTLSLAMMMLNTAHRYFFVANKSSKFLLIHPKKEITTLKTLLFCLIITILNLPRMFYFKIREDNEKCLWYRWSLDSELWFLIYNLIRILILNIGCLTLLAIFNVMLVCKSYRQLSASRSLVISATPSANKRRQKHVQLTMALIVTTWIVVISETYVALFNPVTELFFWPKFVEWPILRTLSMTSWIMLLIEYIGNWLVLFLLGGQFRDIIFNWFRPAELRRRVSRVSISLFELTIN